jgi:hypothetical protein
VLLAALVAVLDVPDWFVVHAARARQAQATLNRFLMDLVRFMVWFLLTVLFLRIVGLFSEATQEQTNNFRNY